MSQQSGVVVWEWRNRTNLWQQYDPTVSNYLEKKHKEDKLQTVKLKHIDPCYLSKVEVNFTDMHQIDYAKKERQTVRRSLYSGSSAVAEGVDWQWADDNNVFHSFDISTMIIIEKHKTEKQVNLMSTKSKMPYTIDYVNLQQRRNETGYERCIRRVTKAKGSGYYIIPGTSEPPSTAAAQASGMWPIPSQPGTGSLRIEGTVSNEDTSSGSLVTRPLDVLYAFSQHVFSPPDNEDCAICMCDLKDVSEYAPRNRNILKLKICRHLYHEACLEQYYISSTQKGESIKCPTCKMIYGTVIGNCPPGILRYRVEDRPVPYLSLASIIIQYDIKGGIQGPEHPSPGVPYIANGFPRNCILPNTDEGVLALKLLIVAWRRRLTFTVGTSLTTGVPHSVIWNEIHHKTDYSSHNSHGYPDPNYLDNLFLELELQGVNKEDSESVTLCTMVP